MRALIVRTAPRGGSSDADIAGLHFAGSNTAREFQSLIEWQTPDAAQERCQSLAV